MKVRYANSLEELQLKSIELNHDHSSILYFGSMHNLPFKYIDYLNKKFSYIVVYEEL